MPEPSSSDGSSLGDSWSRASDAAGAPGVSRSPGDFAPRPGSAEGRAGPSAGPLPPGREGDSGLGDPRRQDGRERKPGRVLSPEENAERDRREREDEAAVEFERVAAQTVDVFRLPASLVSVLTWGVMALASVLALVLVAQGAAAVSEIRALPGPFNWIAGGVALLSASVLVVLVVRLGWALRRLRRTPSVSLQVFGALNQRRRWQHLARGRMDEARAVLHVHLQEYDVRLVRRYLANADGARFDEARRRLIHDADDRSSAEWLDHFADRVQAPVDGIAARRVRSYALKVGLGTAASRFSILDQVIVLSACLALLKELLSLYGLRPTAFQTGLLLARSVVTTYLSGVLHDLSDHGVEVAEGLGEGSADDGLIQSLLGKLGQGAGEVAGASVLAPLAGRTAEAAVNAFLVYRLGSAAVRLIQPIRRS